MLSSSDSENGQEMLANSSDDQLPPRHQEREEEEIKRLQPICSAMLDEGSATWQLQE